MVYTNGTRRERSYWQLKPEGTFRTREEAAGAIRSTLERSVHVRRVGERPPGVLLSGGVDSSIVVGLLSRQQSSPVRTFTVGVEGGGTDERRFAREASQRFGTDHDETVLAADCVNDLPRIIWHLDEPYGNSSMLSVWQACRRASEQVNVLLTGDGGDEAFGGYGRYQELDRFLSLESSPAWLMEVQVRIARMMEGRIRRLTSWASRIRRWRRVRGRGPGGIFAGIRSYLSPDLWGNEPLPMDVERHISVPFSES